MPRQKKDSSTRARRNIAASRAVLPVAHEIPTPPMPPGSWHFMTVAWWEDIWRSPMATEFMKADIHGLYRLAALMDMFWRNPTPGNSAEVRLGQRAYGLSPLDRRRLEWTVEQVDSARDRRRNRLPLE